MKRILKYLFLDRDLCCKISKIFCKYVLTLQTEIKAEVLWHMIISINAQRL